MALGGTGGAGRASGDVAVTSVAVTSIAVTFYRALGNSHSIENAIAQPSAAPASLWSSLRRPPYNLGWRSTQPRTTRASIRRYRRTEPSR
jgi:hypothetical protein